jgi:homogentisate phytyltransferase/homogentisate geranylgeranyltransferase
VRAAAVLWRFGRPHTVVGTAVSIAGLYVIAAAHQSAPGLGDLALTLLAGYAVNLYIVGVNQLEDVDIDRINKPYLPLAAGDLTRSQARAIVVLAAAVPVALALTQGAPELVAVLAGLLVGTAYSVPPLRLKRFPLLASLSITGVRAIVVNLGVYAHFAGTVDGPVWALTAFVLPFSFAIAILKDVPDIEGDRRFHIATFTIRLGARRVLGIGLAALTLAYVGMAALGPLLVEGAQPAVLALTHLTALTLLLAAARTAERDFWCFYMRVWQLFFLEYMIVPLACVAA